MTVILGAILNFWKAPEGLSGIVSMLGLLYSYFWNSPVKTHHT